MLQLGQAKKCSKKINSAKAFIKLSFVVSMGICYWTAAL